MSNCKSFFSGYESRDSNCNSFNNRNMFDEFNGFTGYERGSFDGTRDRNFQYAKGRGSLTPLGGTTPLAKQNAGENCSGSKCGSAYGGIGCPQVGCGCTDKARGTCSGSSGGVLRTYSDAEIMADYRKKQGQGGVNPSQREVADPTGWGCEDISCGSYSGGGRKRCPKGCKCKGGWCVSKNKRVGQGGGTPSQREVGGTDCGGKCGQHWGISCPSGCRCSSTLNGVCESATMRKNQGATMSTNFSGRDMSNGGFRLR